MRQNILSCTFIYFEEFSDGRGHVMLRITSGHSVSDVIDIVADKSRGQSFSMISQVDLVRVSGLG